MQLEGKGNLSPRKHSNCRQSSSSWGERVIYQQPMLPHPPRQYAPFFMPHRPRQSLMLRLPCPHSCLSVPASRPGSHPPLSICSPTLRKAKSPRRLSYGYSRSVSRLFTSYCLDTVIRNRGFGPISRMGLPVSFSHYSFLQSSRLGC